MFYKGSKGTRKNWCNVQFFRSKLILWWTTSLSKYTSRSNNYETSLYSERWSISLSCLRSPWLQLDVVLFLQPSAATCVPCHSLCYSVHLKIAGFLLAARCTKHRINGGLTSEVCSPTGSAASVSLPPHDTPKGPVLMSWCVRAALVYTLEGSSFRQSSICWVLGRFSYSGWTLVMHYTMYAKSHCEDV